MKKNDKNYLDFIPIKNSKITWSEDNFGIVTLEITRKGLFDKIAQNLFKVPKSSSIKLDKLGSCVWKNIDGESSIYDISKYVKASFGKDCEPLYERLITYFTILKDNKFISLKMDVR